jgi:pyruvate/2-oxoglutarate dehydrogenase complex dihydrolipoamide acyltransferase (E2) component
MSEQTAEKKAAAAEAEADKKAAEASKAATSMKVSPTVTVRVKVKKFTLNNGRVGTTHHKQGDVLTLSPEQAARFKAKKFVE